MDYLYNGVQLPALPEWDKTVYPYAVVSTFVDPATENANTKWRYLICFSTVPYVMNSFGHQRFEANEVCSTIGCDFDENIEDTWGLWASIYEYNAVPAGGTLPASNNPIWANFNLYHEDGTLMVAASDPVPVSNPPAPDPFWMTMGWMVGRMIAGMRGKREPVAYLYNGVRLPKLPEWDREAYPYAVIQTVNDTYRLVICMDVMSAEEAGVTVLQNSTIWNCRTYIMDTNSIEWVDNGVYHLSTNIALTGVFWTGTDILNTDGTLYLSASEPVPVYE